MDEDKILKQIKDDMNKICSKVIGKKNKKDTKDMVQKQVTEYLKGIDMSQHLKVKTDFEKSTIYMELIPLDSIGEQLLKGPKENENNAMVNEKSWKQFRDSGLLWWINMILHTFGWSIVVNVEEDGTISNGYPARVKYRGFGNEYNSIGYKQVSKYMNENAEQLQKESRE